MKKAAYDNIGVRDAITRASGETKRIRRRLAKLDDNVLGILPVRLKELDSAIVHAREVISVLEGVREMRRGRD